MKRSVLVVSGAALWLVVSTSGAAHAGPYSDEMAKCLVKSTSDGDKNALVKWMFAAAALHPAVQSIASVSDVERADLNKAMAKMVERLLTESCRAETVEALKNEGTSTIQTSFQVLGQAAAVRLFSDPVVAKSMGTFEQHLDRQKFEELLAR
jgi:hypothetical protein